MRSIWKNKIPDAFFIQKTNKEFKRLGIITEEKKSGSEEKENKGKRNNPELVEDANSPFVIFIGNKRIIKRKEF